VLVLKIVHVSDTHLGYSAFSKVDEESGLNQREMDFYNAFERFVDQVLDIRPDVVLHAGDLFDTVRPTNRAISFALEQFLRITQAGIPVVVIAGNHSTPKLRETGSVFKIFDHLEDLYPIFKERYERVEIGDLVVHAVPHCDADRMTAELERMEPVPGRYNVGMLHAGVSSLQVFRMGDFNEAVVSSSYLRPEFDYFALGHYHNYCQVTDNSYYSGSIERLSFSEAGERKGFILIDLERKRQDFIELEARRMIDLPMIDARHMDAGGLRRELTSRLDSMELEGAIVRLSVKDVPYAVYKGLDFHWLRSLASGAMHFEPKFEVLQENHSVQSDGGSIGSLEREWVSYLEAYALSQGDKDRIRDRGLEYIAKGVGESG